VRVTVIATGFAGSGAAAALNARRRAEATVVSLPQRPTPVPAASAHVAPRAPVTPIHTPVLTPAPVAVQPRPIVVEPRPVIVEQPFVAPMEHEQPVLMRTAAPDPAEDEPVISFPEILARGDSVIEFALEPDEADEPVIMDNGSIRSFNTEAFRVPTFVRKQMD
jgi:hypothetical protein